MNTPWQLIDAYLDHSLTSDETSELRRWLAKDRQHVHEFVLAVNQHRALRSQAQALRGEAVPEGTLHGTEAQPASANTSDTGERVAGHRTPLKKGRRRVQDANLALSGWSHFRQFVLRNPLKSAGIAVAVLLLVGLIHLSRSNHGVLPEVVFESTVNPFVSPPDTFTLRLARSFARYRYPPVRSVGMWLERRVPSYGPGSIVETGSRGSAELRYTNEATLISLKANTRLKVLSARAGKRFELMSGVAQITATAQPVDRPLQVLTPMANVRVLGTKLALTASGRSTRVSVSEGAVRLESRTTGQHTAVTAGERAIAAANTSFTFQTLRPITNHYGAGSILREHWSNVRGRFVRDLTTNAAFQALPSRLEQVSSFEKSDNGTANEDAYGARYRGYLHPPVSGEYTFWVAADDTGEVWLSTDERPENKRQICQASEWSRYFGNWWQYPDQESHSIHLEAGQRYYIEALHKEGGGGDFFAVAWQPPGAELEVIRGADLSPFEPAKLARR